MGPRRDWTAARAKVDAEGRCRLCGCRDRRKLEAAQPKVTAAGRVLKVLYVDPDRVVPACGPFPAGCHGDVEFHRIDLLPHLTTAEQVRAVADAGSIETARVKLAPSAYRVGAAA
jgi:hypothetical protein